MDIKQLQGDYEDLTGKKPNMRWKAETIEAKMEKYRIENKIGEVTITKPETAPKDPIKSDKKLAEDFTTRHEENKKLEREKIYRQLCKIEPIALKGELYAIIDNEYVEWKKAELIVLNKIKNDIDKLIKEKTAELNS